MNDTNHFSSDTAPVPSAEPYLSPPYALAAPSRWTVLMGGGLAAATGFMATQMFESGTGFLGAGVIIMITTLFSLTAAVLTGKWKLVARDRRLSDTMLEQVFAGAVAQPSKSPEQTLNALEVAATGLDRENGWKNLLLRRCRTILTTRGRDLGDVTPDEIAAMTDRRDMDASYIMARAMIWAIPILGFVGTVIGISLAIAGFSTVMTNVGSPSEVTAALQTHLPKVTRNLATAFDTTLLGLLCSLPAMLMMSWVEKRETQYLTELDRSWFCQVVPVLFSGVGGAAKKDNPGAQDQMAETAAELRRLSSHIASLHQVVRDLNEISVTRVLTSETHLVDT